MLTQSSTSFPTFPCTLAVRAMYPAQSWLMKCDPCPFQDKAVKSPCLSLSLYDARAIDETMLYILHLQEGRVLSVWVTVWNRALCRLV